MKTEKKYLPKKATDLSTWYLALIEMADLADYAPVKGTMVIKPYGFAIWENTQKYLDAWFKEGGIKNAYFPLFIPYSLLEKEKQHVKGFSPELAVVTIAGGKELSEPLVIRPTSETIMYQMFSDWISSYKDLPMKINQWTNVVRWELRTYPFLRTSEFLWQEGHTVHETDGEAMDMMLTALEWYKRFYEEVYGISTYVGEKSGSERFAGATRTFSVELVMPDGKALQAATSHHLGQNFSKAFKIQYSDKKNKLQYPYQTSWGLSTRAIGGLIMSHGDDSGLILPPKIAPQQLVILPIHAKDEEHNSKIQAFVRTIEDIVGKAGISYEVDNNTDKSLGYRLNEAEIKGIPLRCIVGLTEYEKKYVTVSRRDLGEKEKLKLNSLGNQLNSMMNDMHDELFEKSKKMKQDMTVEVDTFDEFEKIMKNDKKFIRAYWCESKICETKIKDKTKATTRVVEIDRIKDNDDGKCVYCSNKSRRKWLFAQAY